MIGRKMAAVLLGAAFVVTVSVSTAVAVTTGPIACYSKASEHGIHALFVTDNASCPPGSLPWTPGGGVTPTVTTTYVNSASGVPDVSCNAGDVATGGGASVDAGANGGNGGYLTASHPNVGTGVPTGWHAQSGVSYTRTSLGYDDNTFRYAPSNVYVVCQHTA